MSFKDLRAELNVFMTILWLKTQSQCRELSDMPKVTENSVIIKS